jgi:hypothetical protein
MIPSWFSRALLAGSLLALGGIASADPLFRTERQRWKPVADSVYLQEAAEKVPTDQPVSSLAVYQRDCYAVINGEIYVLRGGRLERVAAAPKGVRSLHAPDGSLWALTETGLYRFQKTWEKVDDRVFVDLCMHLGKLYAATEDDIYRLDKGALVSVRPEGGYLTSNTTMLMEDGTQVLLSPVRLGPIQHIESYSGTLYVLRPGQLVIFDGRRVDEAAFDWGELPSPRMRDMLALGSRLLVTTDRGLGVLRGAALTSLKGKDGLPYEDTTCLAEGFENDLWIGTTKGAIRMVDDQWHYFGAQLWLPGDDVHSIAVDGHVVYVATDRGIGIIRYEPYTLQKKASYYERHIDQWGHKRLGFIHMLYWGGEDKGWVREISDNDGGHTATYLAAMCFKYAVTKDEAARRAAVDSFKAMIWLQQITSTDGFVARAVWSTVGDVDKRSQGGSGGLPAKWYPTKDGLWYWKGDTSSDEINAHFYAVSLFRDLVAHGAEKKRAEEHLARIAMHIINSGWVMRDMDGKPTRWGRWDPDYLFRPYGIYARGLNGMEAQMYMLTARAMTGDQKFQDGFQQLVKWGYPKYTVRQRITFPPDEIAPWDDELAFHCYYTLFRYTDDPTLRSIYLRSLERTWEVKRMEHVAWFNFIYSAVTGNDGELSKAVKHLREWTLDCAEHNYENSHRADLAPEPGYVPYGGGSRGMSPRETCVQGGSRNALPYDGGANGQRITEPTGFLQDYWMGRYHGFIEAPTTSDPALLSIPPSSGQHLGARPYDGPPRPDNL